MRSLQIYLLLWLTTLSPFTWAHDGHSLLGSHWHATDALGFAAAAAVVALGFFFGKK